MTNLEYANARIKGLKGRLLQQNDIKIALELKAVQDFAVWMESTPYKSVLAGKGISDIETALFREWINTNEKIMKLMPEDIQGFFAARTSSQEIEALKFIVSAKKSGRDAGVYAVFLSRGMKSRGKKLAEAETVESLADILGRTDYGFLLKKALEEKKDISHELERYYFENLWALTEKLSGDYRETAEKLIGTEIDAANIMSILRSKALGRQEHDIIPVYHRFGRGGVHESLKADGVSGVLSVISQGTYGKVLEEVAQKFDKDKSLFHFEQALSRHVLRVYRKGIMDVLGIGVPLAYLRLKETEITNLRSIALGLENGLDKSDIEEMIS
ncbi:MAG: V-type ATPase subunit [Candidatus Aenigmatarchaeota archaeon]|nr:MAG: V-type ATPase subunit [Candidatus Aenigmarchaeota archaeon]